MVKWLIVDRVGPDVASRETNMRNFCATSILNIKTIMKKEFAYNEMTGNDKSLSIVIKILLLSMIFYFYKYILKQSWIRI